MNVTWQRLRGIAKKEIWQLSRDRLTAILLISVPLAQILLFGFAIDLQPKRWPSAWVSTASNSQAKSDADDSEVQKLIIAKLNQTHLLSIQPTPMSEGDAARAMQKGDIRFIVQIPATPTHYINRSQALPIGLKYDGSDPYVAMTALMLIARLQSDLPGNAQANTSSKAQPVTQVKLQSELGEVAVTSHSAFPHSENSGAYLVPALAGVILTLTLTLMAAFSMVRERERGTWLSLMSTPVSASLIVFGKLAPYAAIGLMLFGLLQVLAHFLFATPWASAAQWFAVSCFIVGQLGLGASLSLLAKTQMQAMQLGVFFYLPSILLSGFMFPFHAMPNWARMIGELLPLTHFLRILRADLFRQANGAILMELSLPIVLFATLMLCTAILGYHRQIR